MAMLKSKVKSLLSGFQRDRGQDESDLKSEEIHQMEPTDLPHTREDPRKTEEIIQEIEDHYYEEGDIDCSQHELEALGPEINMGALEDRIFSLKTKDTAVYRKIYDLVFANYTAYVLELENVTMLQVSLQDAARTCINARRTLKSAREGVSQGGLGLLGKHRKRERLRTLLDILRTLKTLQRTDARLKVLLGEGDYPAATQLCIECQNAIETYKQFSCVRELAVSLQDIQHDIEQELESALSKVTMKFSAHHYQQVQEAYGILGKAQTAVDILMMKFTTTIHDQAYTVVADYVKMSGENAMDDQQPKVPYANLCKLIQSEYFIPCLMKICEVFWRIMYSYCQVKEWHSKNLTRTPSLDGEEPNGVEIAFNRSYVRQKLDNGLLRVWRDVQQKVRPYILSLDMSHFKYDDFIRVLNIVNRLISVGFEFCGEGSSSLQESMRQQSLNYFKNYHRARLDELRIFLETEAWELCPVRSTFTIHQLREFRFLKSVSTTTSTKQLTPKAKNSFAQQSFDDNPFSVLEEPEEEVEEIIDTSGLEDTISDDERCDDEDISDDLRGSFVDEQTGEGTASYMTRITAVSSRARSRSSITPKGPLLANTTLTVLRFFGNYMQMMNVLQPIAFDVLECLSQLFDYYLFAVHDFFVKDMLESVQGSTQLSSKLTISLKRISEHLIQPAQEIISSPNPQSSEDQLKVPEPCVNPVVRLGDMNSMFGLSCRMVALESLVHLSTEFERLLPYMESMIPEAKRSFLTQFVSHTVQTAPELRKPVYRGIAIKAISFEQILQAMCSVKWDVKEIMSQHSIYVDHLVQEFIRFKDLQCTVDRHIPIPPQVHSTLWEGAIIAANEVFVEGRTSGSVSGVTSLYFLVATVGSRKKHLVIRSLTYMEMLKKDGMEEEANVFTLCSSFLRLATGVKPFSQARKCSNEGRALMQLDFQQYRTKVEQLSKIRPLPGHHFVENYVKAYYLSENDTEEWLRKHPDYTAKQLQSLVMSGVGSRINKKSRQKLFAIVEEMEKKK